MTIPEPVREMAAERRRLRKRPAVHASDAEPAGDEPIVQRMTSERTNRGHGVGDAKSVPPRKASRPHGVPLDAGDLPVMMSRGVARLWR